MLPENTRNNRRFALHSGRDTFERRSSFHGGLSSNPDERAYERMDAAARRGGLQALVTETMKRVRATNSPDKLLGIIQATKDLISDLEAIQRLAHKKEAGGGW